MFCAQSYPTLCNFMDCSPPGSSVHGISQAKILEWVTVPSPRGSSQTRDRTDVSCIPCISGGFLTDEPLGKTVHTSEFDSESEVPQSCLSLCDPIDCSLPGSSIHGIFQVRILEWVAIAFSRRSSQPRD